MLPAGPLRGLLVDGVIAGVGSVLVFLPQILILFLFILALEDSGYLPRAAFLLDRLMGSVGLSGPRVHSAAVELRLRHSRHHGDAHHPESARPPGDDHDRAADDLLGAPAGVRAADRRLHPAAQRRACFNLQGLVLFALYVAGIVERAGGGLGPQAHHRRAAQYRPLMLELPDYRWPNLRNLALGLWERAAIFLTRVGTIILALMVVLWFLSSFPAPPAGRDRAGDPVQHRRHARAAALRVRVRADRLQLADLASRWCPGLAAREVAVGALGTVYALSGTGDDVAGALTPVIAQQLEPGDRRCRCWPGTCSRRSACRRWRW